MFTDFKKIFSFIITACLFGGAASGQSAYWSPVLPDFFPANASNQINGISRISQLKFHPSIPGKLYAVSARGGLFISEDAGQHWTVTPWTDNMPSNRFASVCVDHTDSQVLYLGTGDHDYYLNGTGVWKSTNGGSTFSQTGLSGFMIVDMIMDPADHNILVAATNNGIYKTYNAGSNWVSKTATNLRFDDLKQQASVGSRTLFASDTSGTFFRSVDFGETWNPVTNGIYIPAGYPGAAGSRIAVTPADVNVVYFAMVAKSGTIFKSTDGGLSFVAVKDALPPYLTYYANSSGSSGQGDYNFSIGTDALDANILYLVSQNVWKSYDGGMTWNQLTNWYEKVHTDMHQITVSPYDAGQLWNVNDGGVWLSTDGGLSWVQKSYGIYGYEVYHGNCSPTRRDMISIGTQDNGELYSNEAGWFTNRGGDWFPKCAFDYRPNSSMVYYYGNNNRRDVNGSETTYGLPGNVTSFEDIAFHSSNPDLAFLGDTLIYRTTNLTAPVPSWQILRNTSRKIMAMHCSLGNPNRLYVITSDSRMYNFTNALSTSGPFNFTAPLLPSACDLTASITSIKTNPDVLYITCNNKVYRSSNNGGSWADITANLPPVNHVRILSDEYYSGSELVFIASDNAVYYKFGSQNTWTIFNNHLPLRTSITDMNIYNDSTSVTRLRVYLYGRGVWETPISNLRPLNALFGVNFTTPCAGETVQFSDQSNGSPTSWNWSFPGGIPSSSNFKFPVITYPNPGQYNVTLTVGNGITTSTITRTAFISTIGKDLPVKEGFESSQFPSPGWSNMDGGTDGYIWQRNQSANSPGSGTACLYFNNYNQDGNGNPDDFLTPNLNFADAVNLKLFFDVAYQPYSLTGEVDSLAIRISTDCGVSFQTIYLKWGNDLATVSGTNTNEFIPTSSQWRKDSIDLSAFSGATSVVIAFENIGHFGNNLYIDNINVAGLNRVIFKLKSFLEGFYLGSNLQRAVADPVLQPLICDTITVGFASPVFPFDIEQTITGLLKTDGMLQLNLPAQTFYGNSYYLVLRHRNSLETWSAAPVSFNSDAVSYDFTANKSMAYGGNLADHAGVWCVFSGDVNQDADIDMVDYEMIENATQSFSTGYIPQDLDGNRLVESADCSLIENNLRLLLVLRRPY